MPREGWRCLPKGCWRGPDANLLTLNKRVLAGDALPNTAAPDPCVGKTHSMDVVLPFGITGFAIDSGDHRGVAVHGHVQTFVVEVVGLVRGLGNIVKVFGFIHDAAVKIDVGEGVRNDRGDRTYIVA